MAVHITNRYLDLMPLVAALSRVYHLDWLDVIETETDGKGMYINSRWVLVARVGVLDSLKGRKNVVSGSQIKSIDPWTDDYSNLLQSIR